MTATDASFEVPVTVEFEDVDSYGIVHHTKLVAYLERARVRFLRSLGLSVYPEGMSIVLYGLAMRFKRPAFALDHLVVAVRVGSLDDYRLQLHYRITREKQLLATATTGIACIEKASGNIIPAPDRFIQSLRQWMEESGGCS